MGTDSVQPFRIEGANVRGRLARLGPTYQEILRPHDYPLPVARLLGETLALTAALATTVKLEDGVFILQTQGDGPVGMMVADVTSGGDVRGYARYDDSAFAAGADEIPATVPHLLGAGHLAFTVDQGAGAERYQGITDIEGATIAECAQSYFRQSEQLETAIMLAAQPSEDDFPPRAAVLMIQRMPGEDRVIMTQDEEEEHWRNAVILMSSLTVEELLDPRINDNQLLYRLYHEKGVRLYESRPMRFHCRCSRDKVERTLAAFPPSELDDMKTDDGFIVATCEFCQSEFKFDDDGLAQFCQAAETASAPAADG